MNDDSMLSALLTATIQVLEATKELKSNQESLKSEIDELKQQVSESSNPEIIRTLISEELIEVIEKGFSASTKDYSEPLSKVAHGFAVTQENLKKLAKHVDDMSENMTEISEATIENSARVKSLDVRLATMVHDTLDSEDSLDKSLETLKKMTK